MTTAIGGVIFSPSIVAGPPPTIARPRARASANVDRVVFGPCKVNAAQRRRRGRKGSFDEADGGGGGDDDGGRFNNGGGGGGGGGDNNNDDEDRREGDDEDEFWSREAFETLLTTTSEERILTELDAHALFAWQTTSVIALVGCVQHVIDAVADAWHADGRVAFA